MIMANISKMPLLKLNNLMKLPFNKLSIRSAQCYSPSIRRNDVPYINFDTYFPKQPVPNPTVLSPFTLAKQKRMEKELEDSPQSLIDVRVISALSCKRTKHSGRNNTGQLTVRHRGGGHAQRLRFIDFKRGRKDIYATVLRIEYDPVHSARIALIQYDDAVLSYILAPLTCRPGNRLIASTFADILPGNSLPLSHIPVGTIIHNIELRPGHGGQISRAAGTYATLLNKDPIYATIKLSSSEIRKFPLECWSTIGQVSNVEHSSKIWRKAGASRWRGWRPSVRGVAKSPFSHPHGGGTSDKHTKRPPVSPWGVHRSGYKTRAPNKPLGLIVRRKLCGRLQKKFGLN